MSTSTSKSASSQTVIRIENVWKSYDDGAIAVLNGVDLEVEAGQTMALCGPSGCGKSTLLHLAGGFDVPDRGKVTVNGRDLSQRRDRLAFTRFEIGFVFQLHNLIPDLTLQENCLLPVIAAGMDNKAAKQRLGELAEQTGVLARLDHRIQKLSGGERQRAAICRALMNRPGILLADEPTGSLDERTSSVVFELLIGLARNESVTLLMATHDRALAAKCDRLVEMHDGRIREVR